MLENAHPFVKGVVFVLGIAAVFALFFGKGFYDKYKVMEEHGWNKPGPAYVSPPEEKK